MTSFTIALLQLIPEVTTADNLKMGLQACKRAQQMGADLALFPEMWRTGYNVDEMQMHNAINHHDDFIKQFCKKAQELSMAIAITYLGKGVSKPTNNVAIIDARGNIILDYAKVHICSFEGGPEVTLEPGNEFKVAQLTFAAGALNIGAMICFDREFPESARTLMLKGAEIIITPNACQMHNNPVLGNVRLAQYRTRAFENMIGVALANYPAPYADGHSCAFDTDGKQIVIADEEEGIYLAQFDLDKIRAWQKKEVWGDTYRRPELYKT